MPRRAGGCMSSLQRADLILHRGHPLAGRQPSDKAISLTGKYAPPAGYEVVPTSRARALVAR